MLIINHNYKIEALNFAIVVDKFVASTASEATNLIKCGSLLNNF
jgi:hypothetical protein